MDYAIGIMIRRHVTVGANIRNSSDQILLQRRSDDGFSLPGGSIEAGETVLECLECEILKETGWQVEVKNLLGIYMDSDKFPWEFIRPKGVGTDTDSVMNAIFAQAYEVIKRNPYYSSPATQTHNPDGNTVQFVALVFEAQALKLCQEPASERLEIRFFISRICPKTCTRTTSR